MDLLGEWVITPMAILITMAIGLGMFIGIPYGIYKLITYTPPETFDLRVDSWKCTYGYIHEYRVCSKGCYDRREYVCTKWEAK